MNIDINRTGTGVVASIKIDEKTVFTQQIMGEHKITAQFVSYSVLPVQLGDYIIYGGENFYIGTVPNVIKHSNFAYEYTIIFEAEVYKLYNKLFMDEGAADFSYFGTAQDLLQLVIDNMNEIEPGWTLGTIGTTEGQLMSFSGDSCRTALTKIAEAFGMEFILAGKAISLVLEVGHDTTLSFQYGKGKGLYELTRQYIQDKNVVTRVYGFGSDKNISTSYRNGAKKLIFANKYLEENTALYGIIEGSANFDDVYPHRDGTVTAVNATDIFQITDSSLDFDINAQLMSGVTAAIVFKTGDLAGYQFDIISYDAANKIIHFKQFTDSNDYLLPNSTFKPSVNDIYTLVNIIMPQTYIDAAETLLQSKTQTYLDENSVPQVAYSLKLDPFFVKQNGTLLHTGDRINITDAGLGINKTIRVSAVSFPLYDANQITATIADTIPYTIQERLIAKAISNSNVIRDVDRTRSEASRINAMRTRELQNLVFDPDGYFDTDHIKPESIETLMLSVGAKSQDFNLSGVTIQPNATGDPNSLTISAGQLIHHEIEIDGLGDVWEMAAASLTGLDPASAYYVYAKCSQTELTGTWETSETPVKVDDITGYYVFNLGVLYSVAGGRRDFAFTNGMTFISGDNVTTGRIQDLSKQNYLDLNSGQMNLGNASSGLDWDVTKADTLTIRGGVVVNPGGASEPMGVFRGAYDPTVTYYQGDSVTYGGSTFKVIAATPISGITPNDDGTNYIVIAAKGQTGAGGVLRVIYAKNSDADNAPALTLTDANPAGWSQQMPQVDTYWLLATQEGDYIATQSGDQYLTTVDGEYIWAATEELNTDGTFNSWSAPTRISGRNGIPNEYTEYRFQKSGSPTTPPTLTNTDAVPAGWDIEMPTIGTAEYIWMIKANKLPNGTLVSAWSDPVRVNGQDGIASGQGNPGPFMMYRGAWDSTKIYTGNAQHIDAVSYNGSYYIARTDAGDIPAGTLVTNATYWNLFSGQFESVATGLLLAQLAYIENLGVRHLSTSDAGQRIVIDGSTNTLIFYDQFGHEVFRLDGNIDMTQAGNALGGAKATNPNNGNVTFNTGNGLFSNAGGMQFLSATSGLTTNASIVGLLFNRNSGGQNGISAAVVGLDETTDPTDGSQAWGGYFNSLKVTGKIDLGQAAAMIGGQSVGVKTTTVNYTLEDSVTLVTCYNIATTDGAIAITFPATPSVGRMVIVKRVNSGGVQVMGNGNTFRGYTQNFTNYSLANAGSISQFVWDGSYWITVDL